ncbi:PEP-CTERM sorting domain-containing protein [Methylophilus sp. TWE2]|uniref:PEP-CTERM sorting domain-containing protein n=1 Tax=Methylophilus sp. TWE2 TaxID=1662285 RepID=UPI000670C629|nr:PEP-CTERM sorting domain-containing protein [Methylophilus sp. TWE2]AKR43374.1 hypothetical protein ACJ67_07990 [Methylophilus sp. TWE2]
MRQLIKRSVIGLALLAMSSGVFAATYTFNQTKGMAIPVVSETGNFVLSGYAISATATVLDIKNAAGDVVLSLNKDTSTNQFALGFTSFIAGNYTLFFNASVLDAKGSFTSALGSISGQTAIGASPVPEAESSALMLMGLGILGLIVRRKSA